MTGSNSGIGYEAARMLAEKNVKVILAVCNLERGETALNKIKSESPQVHRIKQQKNQRERPRLHGMRVED